jgi:hypothetical protein
MKLPYKGTAWVLLALILVVSITAGCNSKTGLQTEPPQATESQIDIMQYDTHTESAFTAYPRALEEGQRWNPEAKLYQIALTRQMELNLSLPPGPMGWFFMFKEPNSQKELFVEIVEGSLFGRLTAEPIIVGEPPYTYQPIDITNLKDSNEALLIYWNDGGEAYYNDHPETEFDLRLVYLKGLDNPIWSIFDSKDEVTPLYNVDAVTGAKTNDPFEMVK